MEDATAILIQSHIHSLNRSGVRLRGSFGIIFGTRKTEVGTQVSVLRCSIGRCARVPRWPLLVGVPTAKVQIKVPTRGKCFAQVLCIHHPITKSAMILDET